MGFHVSCRMMLPNTGPSCRRRPWWPLRIFACWVWCFSSWTESVTWHHWTPWDVKCRCWPIKLQLSRRCSDLIKAIRHGFEMASISCCVFNLFFSCWTFPSQTYRPVVDTRVTCKVSKTRCKVLPACTLGPVGQWQGDWVCDWWSKTCTDLSKVRPEIAQKKNLLWMSRLENSCCTVPTWSSNHSLDGYGSGFGKPNISWTWRRNQHFHVLNLSPFTTGGYWRQLMLLAYVVIFGYVGSSNLCRWAKRKRTSLKPTLSQLEKHSRHSTKIWASDILWLPFFRRKDTTWVEPFRFSRWFRSQALETSTHGQGGCQRIPRIARS